MDAVKLRIDLIDWIRDWFKDKSGPVVIGISGGKDSTICAALLCEALGKHRVFGILMPNGVQGDIQDSYKVVDFLELPYTVINIMPAYSSLVYQITNPIGNLPKEISLGCATNTPARLRMTTLYAVAAQLGGFVVNTCNLSEDVVGYSTVFGDSAGDFSPFGKLTVTELLELGDNMCLPKDLVHKTPSDGMCGHSDEDALGFTYAELDEFIRTGKKPSMTVYERIMYLNKKSHFKHEIIRLPTFDPGFPIAKELNWN